MFCQHVVPDFAHQLGTRVKVLVDTVTEAHQLEAIVFVFGTGNVFRHIRDVTDFFQHVQTGFVGTTVRRTPQAGFVGTTVRRTPQAGNTGGDGGGTRRTGQA